MTPFEESRRKWLQAYLDGQRVQFRDPQYFRNWLDVSTLHCIIDPIVSRQFRVKQ